MHKLILWIFKMLKNSVYVINLTGAFLIFLISVYWIETITKVNWGWLNFAKPFLNALLNFANFLLPIKMNSLAGDFKYSFVVVIALIIVLMIVMIYLLEKIQDLKYDYEKLHIEHKLAVEKSLNKKLENAIVKEQVVISKYMVMIHTQPKKMSSLSKESIDINKENKIMNDFVLSNTDGQLIDFKNGFLYFYKDFNDIDSVLDIMFKLLKSYSKLNYAICIQVGNDLKKFRDFVKIKEFGKILFNAETLLRYKHNKEQRYKTQSAGVYQKEDGTLEVHEFIEKE